MDIMNFLASVSVVQADGGGSICSRSDIKTIVLLVKKIVNYVRWGAVIILVLLIVLDIAKAVIAGKEDEMKKAQNLAIKRLIYGVVIFLIPVVVRLAFGLLDNSSADTITTCILRGL